MDLVDKTKSPTYACLQTPERTAHRIGIIPDVLFRAPCKTNQTHVYAKISISIIRKPVLYKIN